MIGVFLELAFGVAFVCLSVFMLFLCRLYVEYFCCVFCVRGRAGCFCWRSCCCLPLAACCCLLPSCVFGWLHCRHTHTHTGPVPCVSQLPVLSCSLYRLRTSKCLSHFDAALSLNNATYATLQQQVHSSHPFAACVISGLDTESMKANEVVDTRTSVDSATG